MHRSPRAISRLPIALAAFVLGAAGTAGAVSSYGTFVDNTCTANGWVPAKPFNPSGGSASRGDCALCHATNPPSTSLTPAGDQFRRSGHTDVTPFCAPAAVNLPPVFTPIAAQTATAGSVFELVVMASDPENSPLLMSVANAPTGSVFIDAGNGSGTFRWTPGPADGGPHTLTFHAADTGTPMAVASMDVTIAVGGAVNLPPVLAPIGNQQVDPGQMLSFTLSATDPENQALAYSASSLPPGSSLSGANFSWMPNAGQQGPHSMTFQVMDAGTPPMSDSETIVVTVGHANQPPVLAPIGNRQTPVGQALHVALTASDPDGDRLMLACTGLPADAQFTDHADGTGELAWTPMAAGRFDVTCRATDAATPAASDEERFSLTAVDPASAAAPTLDDAFWSQDEDRDGGMLHVRGLFPVPSTPVASATNGSNRHHGRGARPSVDVFAVLADGTNVALSSGGLGLRGGEMGHGGFHVALSPFIAPCSVAVSTGGAMSAPIGVRGAPADCENTLLMHARVQLACDGVSLRVMGSRGPVGGQVLVRDADTDALLATLPVTSVASGKHARRRALRFEGAITLTPPAPRAIDFVAEVVGKQWTLEPSTMLKAPEECRRATVERTNGRR